MADIGATTTRCALVDDKGLEIAPEIFANADFTSVTGALRLYLDHRRSSDRPVRAALAVAAPINGDDVQMVNIGWRFSQQELKRELDLKRLHVINDFAAIAWALPQLTPADAVKIGGGESVPRATLAALGPGSGLGVSALAPARDGWAVVSGGMEKTVYPIRARPGPAAACGTTRSSGLLRRVLHVPRAA